jgi:hypothetical protein
LVTDLSKSARHTQSHADPNRARRPVRPKKPSGPDRPAGVASTTDNQPCNQRNQPPASQPTNQPSLQAPASPLTHRPPARSESRPNPNPSPSPPCVPHTRRAPSIPVFRATLQEGAHTGDASDADTHTHTLPLTQSHSHTVTHTPSLTHPVEERGRGGTERSQRPAALREHPGSAQAVPLPVAHRVGAPSTRAHQVQASAPHDPLPIKPSCRVHAVRPKLSIQLPCHATPPPRNMVHSDPVPCSLGGDRVVDLYGSERLNEDAVVVKDSDTESGGVSSPPWDGIISSSDEGCSWNCQSSSRCSSKNSMASDSMPTE